MEMKKGFKMTSLGLIPKDWDITSIKDLLGSGILVDHLDGNHGALYPRSYEFVDWGIPYISANDFVTGQVNLNSCKFLKIERAKKFVKGVAKNGDVLFAHNATVGPVAILYTNWDFVILSTTATYFRCDLNRLHNSYLLYYMESSFFVRQYSAVMSQSTRNQVPITTQRKFHIIIPPTLTEQRAIATALSDVDRLLSAYDRLIAKKKAIKQGAMQELLTGRRRLEGFGGEWEVKKLEEVLKVRHGKSQHAVSDKNGSYPILATGGQIGWANTFLYNKPSVLIGRKGTIDVPRYMDTPFWCVDTLFYTEIFDGAIPKFLFYRFNLINWYNYNEASGVPSLNASTIESIEIALPKDKKEQAAIAQILNDMDAEIAALERQRDKYKAVKQGMMQELLTGKTRLI